MRHLPQKVLVEVKFVQTLKITFEEIRQINSDLFQNPSKIRQNLKFFKFNFVSVSLCKAFVLTPLLPRAQIISDTKSGQENNHCA